MFLQNMAWEIKSVTISDYIKFPMHFSSDSLQICYIMWPEKNVNVSCKVLIRINSNLLHGFIVQYIISCAL